MKVMSGRNKTAHRLVFVGSDADPPLVHEEIPIPELKPGEILGKVLMASICGSDLHTISGRRKEAVPSILGHEGVIELIDHKRASEAGFQKGDRLTFHVVNCCSKCERCRDGLQQKCLSLFKGCGLLGIYGSALLHEAGFSKVFCSDINADRLTMVKKFGGIPLQAGMSAPGGPEKNSVDVVIEVCGVPGVIEEGIKVLRPGGLYVFIGMVHPNSKLDITGEQIIRKCLTIKGIHNYGRQHLDEAVSFLSRTCEKYPYKELFSQPYKLADFKTALVLSQQQTFYRICVEP
ncbi:PREDICTED: L-threonine 3-dehydrogenase-like [Acropora digitifera]|uniref:L-threonine 3-dehydrogenase-like n=1 Tax=Acropora digitifera TaxID=70779 RepID=UPI00077A32D5|nr:PREDICTED: L-threonine 3-dehydrogenase-like [Acropora digitifera]